MSSKRKLRRRKKTAKKPHRAASSSKTPAARIKESPTPHLKIEINNEQLHKIEGPACHIEGIIRGNFDQKILPTKMVISLKVGAQVMLLNNDPNGRWVNGSVGRVEEILGAKGSSPETIIVELTDGSLVEVEPFTWEIFEYRYDEDTNSIKSQTIGSFTQFPLRLAWAITIHKSQGKTFQRIILDIQRGTFSPGQVYVALSRCTTLEGIVLRQPPSRRSMYSWTGGWWTFSPNTSTKSRRKRCRWRKK